MDGNEPAKPAPRRKWNQYDSLGLGIFLFLFLGLMGLGGLLVAPVKIGFFLVAGWIWFLGRVVPEIHFNWAAIGMFLLCSALVVFGLQRLGGSLATKAGLSWSRRWPWGIYLGCWILFLAAMGFTGAVHQIGWLWSSGEPWIENGSRKRWEWIVANRQTKQAAIGVQIAMSDAKGSPVQVRSLIAEECRQFCDDCIVLIFPAESGPVRAILVVPRSVEAMKRYGFFRIDAAGDSTQEPGDQLDPILARLIAGQFDPVPQL